MYRDAQGLVFVCDTASLDNVAQLDYFYESFVNQSGLNYKNCLVLQHSKQPESKFPSEPLCKFEKMHYFFKYVPYNL